MTVHGHHAAWQGDMMHGEVNMINSNAALDGGKRNGVSDADAHGTLTHTVCLSAIDTGDKRSCAAVGGLRCAYLVEFISLICIHSSNGASP